MIQTATAMTARQNLGELLAGVQYRHDSVLITKAGKAVAALVDVDLFQRIRSMKETFERLSHQLVVSYKNVDAVTADAEISEALQAVKKKKEKREKAA